MRKNVLIYSMLGVAIFLLSACAESNYNSGYNSYDNRSNSDKQIDKVIDEEMNSLSDKDIAQLNTLK